MQIGVELYSKNSLMDNSSEAKRKKDEEQTNTSKEEWFEMKDEVSHYEHYRDGGKGSISFQ